MRKGLYALGVVALAAAILGPAVPASGAAPSSVSGVGGIICKTVLSKWPTSAGPRFVFAGSLMTLALIFWASGCIRRV